MKLCYQVSTPEVRIAPGVTSYQGDFEKSLQALVACGYEGVELMVRDPGQLDFRSLAGLVEKYKYEVPMICTGELYGQDKLSFSDPSDEVRDEAVRRVKASIDMATVFGSQINLGRVRGGYLPGIDWKVTRDRIFAAILEITKYSERKGVVIALEPVNTLALNYINTTLEGLEMVRKVDSSSFRLMIDTAHMHIEDRDIEHSVRQSRDFITFVHLADSNRKCPGFGIFDFAGFIRLLDEVKYDGFMSIEVFSLPDQDTALRKGIEFIRPLMAKRS